MSQTMRSEYTIGNVTIGLSQNNLQHQITISSSLIMIWC